MLIEYVVDGLHDIDDEDDREGFEIDYFNDKFLDFEFVAVECANNYHNSGYCENNYPLFITIFADGKMIGDFKVEMELHPHFSAEKIEK